MGRLTGIWAPNYDYTSFSYDNGGRLVEKWFPNGVDAQYSWNADNTLASLTNKAGSTTLSSHVYGYDPLGNRSAQTENINGASIGYAYQYDNLNRLTQVSNGTAAQQENYSYDPLGNRTAKTVNATAPNVIAYVYDQANQLKEIHQTNAAGALLGAMVYDPNGSLTAKCEGTVTTNGTTCTGTTVTSLSYDALNRMVQASKTGQSNQTYAYDDSGRRIAKTIGTTITNFLYSGPDIVAEYAATWGLPTAQYTHGPNQDEPIERITATAAQYFHHDGLGSVVALTNNLGGTDATQRFDAWGNQIAATGTQTRYGYTGREPDETGLIYYRARYYDPAIGRFAQRDPMGLAAGINLFTYVNNNPINLTDPLGLYVETAVSGNNVTLNLPVVFTGPNATPAAIAAYSKQMASAWSGQIGDYRVQTQVTTPAPGTPRSQYNVVEIGPLDPLVAHGQPFVNTVAGSYMKLGPLATGDSGTDAYRLWTAGHEAGHLMGLVDMYTGRGTTLPQYKGNIMGEAGGVPEALDISNIIYLKSVGNDGGHAGYPSPAGELIPGGQNLTGWNPPPPPKH